MYHNLAVHISKTFCQPCNRVSVVLHVHVLDLASLAFSIEYSMRALALFCPKAFKDNFSNGYFSF